MARQFYDLAYRPGRTQAGAEPGGDTRFRGQPGALYNIEDTSWGGSLGLIGFKSLLPDASQAIYSKFG